MLTHDGRTDAERWPQLCVVCAVSGHDHNTTNEYTAVPHLRATNQAARVGDRERTRADN